MTRWIALRLALRDVLLWVTLRLALLRVGLRVALLRVGLWVGLRVPLGKADWPRRYTRVGRLTIFAMQRLGWIRLRPGIAPVGLRQTGTAHARWHAGWDGGTSNRASVRVRRPVVDAVATSSHGGIARGLVSGLCCWLTQHLWPSSYRT